MPQPVTLKKLKLPTKVHLVKAMVFPVIISGCESCTIKKAEHQRIDAFELWYWRRLLRVPWTAKRSNQSILKEISPEYSLEVLMLKLKVQYFGHQMWRTNSFEKTLMLGKIEWEGEGVGEDRGWDGWMASLTQWTWVWASSGSWWCTRKPGVLQSMGSQRVGDDWVTELNWTEQTLDTSLRSSPCWGTASQAWSLQKDHYIKQILLYIVLLDCTFRLYPCSIALFFVSTDTRFPPK